MPEPLEARNRITIKLLLEYVGERSGIRFRELRKAGFPERLAEALRSNSEYLDSLANREFQELKRKGWIELDGTGSIEILHVP